MTQLAVRIDEALRMVGRLVAFAAATGVVFFGLGVAFKPVFPEGLPLGAEGRLIYLLLLVMALLVAQVLMVAVAERGDWRHSGLGKEGWSPKAIALGIGVGVLVASLLPLVVRYSGFGDAATVGWSTPTATVAQLVVLSTLVDALMLRGYAIGLLASRWGELAAIALTALVATLLEVQGQSATAEAAAHAFMLAAVLGALRLRTGSLPAAWLAQLAGALIGEAAGPGPSVATAGLLAVVTFLLLRPRPRTTRPGRRPTTSGA